ncbi:MAG: hypothetical protein HY063_06315, partial [Bacteroidetes bacterium]|nr:hypothetical protein [Bacteroidota bacterium]
MKKELLFLFITVCVLFLHGNIAAQNQNVGIGTLTPNASAVLDLSPPLNDKGFLVPRLTALQRLAITTPANGLLVYDTDSACFFFYKQISSSWNSLCNSGITGGIGPTGSTGATGTAGTTGATGPT